jgi:hypothetical protein
MCGGVRKGVYPVYAGASCADCSVRESLWNTCEGEAGACEDITSVCAGANCVDCNRKGRRRPQQRWAHTYGKGACVMRAQV